MSVSTLEVVIDQFPDPSAVVEPTEPSISDVNATVLAASAVPVIVGVLSLVRSSVDELPMSLPAARSRANGTAGAEVSIVTANADDATLVLPTTSVDVAVRLWTPSASTLDSIDQTPDPSAVVEPTEPSISEVNATVLPISAVPLIVGVVSLVLSSVDELPLSLRASRSRAAGAAGADVSIVIDSADDGSLAPVPLLAVAVNW